MKRIMGVLLAVVMLMALLPITGEPAQAADTDADNVVYHTVKFDVSSAPMPIDTPESQTIEHGQKLTLPKLPDIPGWTFQGWRKDSYTGNNFFDNTDVQFDMTLYAVWSCNVILRMEPAGAGKIGLDTGSGMEYVSGSKLAYYYSYYDQPFIIEAVPNEGYSFQGWRKDSETGEIYSTNPRIELTPDGNTILYAVFGGQVTGISLNESSCRVDIGAMHFLTATITPSDAPNKSIVWTSSKPSVATVDTNGCVLGGASIGTTTVSATTVDGGYTAKCTVKTMFKDVKDSSAYYYKPVYWAALNNITKGYITESDQGTSLYGKFGIDENCTRGALMVFLWRLAGKPSVSGIENPFNDVDKAELGTTYYNAILWGADQGITKGYPDGGFHPDDPVVRKDIMIMLYRFAGKPKITNPKEMTFTDVVGVYPKTSDTYKAILWGYSLGITNGYSSGEYAGQFGCLLDCLRKDIVTFLYRYKGKPKVDY